MSSSVCTRGPARKARTRTSKSAAGQIVPHATSLRHGPTSVFIFADESSPPSLDARADECRHLVAVLIVDGTGARLGREAKDRAGKDKVRTDVARLGRSDDRGLDSPLWVRSPESLDGRDVQVAVDFVPGRRRETSRVSRRKDTRSGLRTQGENPTYRQRCGLSLRNARRP